MIFTAIVASARARTGKTLLARLLAENFILSGQRPAIYDTDSHEPKLSSYFPDDAVARDLDRVPDQMALFDTLVAESSRPQVVDVTHRSFRKFFDLMRDSSFVMEARTHRIEPVVFYIPATDPDSFESGRQVRDELGDCPFVVVENTYLGDVRSFARFGAGYHAMMSHRPRVVIPALEESLVKTIDDPMLSISNFIRQPHPELSFAVHDRLGIWLLQTFRQIYGVMQDLGHRYDEGLAQPRQGGFSR